MIPVIIRDADQRVVWSGHLGHIPRVGETAEVPGYSSVARVLEVQWRLNAHAPEGVGGVDIYVK
jgi:hypothetical protein